MLIDQSLPCWGDNGHDALTDGIGPTVVNPESVLNLSNSVGP